MSLLDPCPHDACVNYRCSVWHIWQLQWLKAVLPWRSVGGEEEGIRLVCGALWPHQPTCCIAFLHNTIPQNLVKSCQLLQHVQTNQVIIKIQNAKPNILVCGLKGHQGYSRPGADTVLFFRSVVCAIKWKNQTKRKYNTELLMLVTVCYYTPKQTNISCSSSNNNLTSFQFP